MNPIVKIIFAVFFMYPFVVAQEMIKNENLYPKFIPYAVETDTVINNFNYMDIENLGKEQPAKFLSIDRFANKYPSFNPYHYTANNPLLYIDINGDSIQVSGMQSQLQSNLISGLVQTTGIPLYITETGMLAATPIITIFGQTVHLPSAYGSSNSGGSQEAASFLNFALGNSTIVNVVGTNVIGSQGGGQLVRLNQNQIEGFINGTPADLNSATMGYGMVFLHELTHSNLGQFYYNSPTPLVDPSPGSGGTGFVVDFMNRIRSELGQDYGQRLSYEASQGAIFNYIPFNSINGRTRITFPR